MRDRKLRRAVMISKVLDIRTIASARMAEALDALRCAVLLISEHGTILHADQEFLRLINYHARAKVPPLQTAKRTSKASKMTKGAWIFGAICVVLWVLAHLYVSPEEQRRQQAEMMRTIAVSCRANSVTEDQTAACVALATGRY
jgi:hypothetical protein